jgi:hypothetical protein
MMCPLILLPVHLYTHRLKLAAPLEPYLRCTHKIAQQSRRYIRMPYMLLLYNVCCCCTTCAITGSCQYQFIACNNIITNRW